MDQYRIVKQVLLRPGEFFRGRKESYSLNEAFYILGILTMVSYIISTGTLFYAQGTGGGLNIPLMVMALLVSGGLYGLFWLLQSAFFHVVSVLLGGEGSFDQTLWVVAYGYIPLILAFIVLELPYRIYLGASGDLTDVSRSSSAVLSKQTGAGEFHIFVYWASFLFIIWGAYIWTQGLKTQKDLSVRRGMVGPVILLVAIFLNKLF
ncbi:MAG: YIP1 family protein [Halobacteria archaeon]